MELVGKHPQLHGSQLRLAPLPWDKCRLSLWIFSRTGRSGSLPSPPTLPRGEVQTFHFITRVTWTLPMPGCQQGGH